MSAETSEIYPGIYVINSQQTSDVVYRHPVEDRSLRPKPIYALHNNVQAHGKWKVEKKHDGKYVLKALNAPVGPHKDHSEHFHLYAFLTEQDESVEWEISDVISTQHRRGYIIETTLHGGRRIGWSATGKDEGKGIPIAVIPLPATRSLPPQYRPSDVFVFTRIDRLEDD